jgi:prepilin-type N-terminal cleavage/methylation domain-containing protein
MCQPWLGSGSHPATSGARGMTLVELLVVLVILSILSSLSLAGLSVARTNAKRAKTAATIRKLSEIILPYYEDYATRRPTISNQSQLLAAGRTILGDAKQTAIRRLMALELPERASDFRGAFPEAGSSLNARPFSKAYGSVEMTLRDVPPCTRRYYSLTLNPNGTKKDPVLSSELLYLIVTRGPVADSDIIAHFRDDEIRDTNGNNLPEFVDGWNRPIQFRRWPIGFQSPMQPIDGTRGSIEPLISNAGHRLVPLIFSAGADGAYDIAGNLTAGDVDYVAHGYDPFETKKPAAPTTLRLAIAPNAPLASGSVVLTGSLLAGGPLVLQATRVTGAASMPPNAFQTIGSECDVDSPDGTSSNGVLESIDNIHNHDMTR